MQLLCDKFKETMESEDAECRHPEGFCQTRTSCIIHFMEKERKREEAQGKKSSLDEDS